MNKIGNEMRAMLRGTGKRAYLVQFTELEDPTDPSSARVTCYEPEAAPSAEECAELVPTLGWWRKMVVAGRQPEIEQIWCAPGS